MTEPRVKPGYKVGREHGLTANERAVLKGLLEGKRLTNIADDIGVSRARTAKIAKDLVPKGWLTPAEKQGRYLIETKRIPEIQSW